MKEKLPLLMLFALLASSAIAANPKPVTVYTFLCNGDQSQREGRCPDGGRPDSLIQGSDGSFYGAAQVSVEGSSTPTGGAVFSVTSAGVLTVLHTFAAGSGKNYANGNLPGWLIEGPDGKLYGVTAFGGIGGCEGYCGYGVLYRVNTDGSDFQVVYKFCSKGECGDLRETASAPVTGADGNLYGTIDGGKAPYGSIYRITPSTGAMDLVVNFNFPSGVGVPSGLTLAPDGSFYAIAVGSLPAYLMHYIPATGELTTTAVKFPLFENLSPSSPHSGLIFGPNGNLYGLFAVYAVNGRGLFEVEPDGSHLQLFRFYNHVPDGGTPDGLILASDGNFWMAEYNGKDTYGDIITLSPTDGTMLQRFSLFAPSMAVGAYPGELVQAKDGTLWGATYQYGKAPAGHFGDGTVFSLNAGLPPR
jgi:sugar lactone lactonase YvrE